MCIFISGRSTGVGLRANAETEQIKQAGVGKRGGFDSSPTHSLDLNPVYIFSIH